MEEGAAERKAARKEYEAETQALQARVQDLEEKLETMIQKQQETKAESRCYQNKATILF